MSDFLLMIAGFSLFVFLPFSLIMLAIQAIRKKPKKLWLWLSILFFSIFLVFEFMGIFLGCKHNYQLIDQIDATCTEKGNNSYQCSVCGKTKEETISALDHNYVITDTADTLSSELVYTCSRCGDTYCEPVLNTTTATSEYTEETTVPTTGYTEPSTPPTISTVPFDSSLINVRYEKDYIDEDRLHLIVYIQNNSEHIFTGTVYVTFYSFDGVERLGSESLSVDELSPGRESWAKFYIKAYSGIPQMEVEFGESFFTPLAHISSSIDENVTKAVTDSYKLSFEGVTWFCDIVDIKVYTDGSCRVSITNDAKQAPISYASVIWGCATDYGVNTVRVEDENGTILAYYP